MGEYFGGKPEVVKACASSCRSGMRQMTSTASTTTLEDVVGRASVSAPSLVMTEALVKKMLSNNASAPTASVLTLEDMAGQGAAFALSPTPNQARGAALDPPSPES